MKTNEILAVVKFNKGEALVLKNPINLLYERIGSTIVGKDDCFYTCLVRNSSYAKAFGGREFDLTMKDGEVVKCKGDWWDSVSDNSKAIMKGKVISVTASSLSSLGGCYVFTGYYSVEEEYEKFRASYTGRVYGYQEFKSLFIHPIKDPQVSKYCALRDNRDKRISRFKKLHARMKTKLREAQEEFGATNDTPSKELSLRSSS